MSRWSSQEDLRLRQLVRRNIINYTNIEPNYLFEVTQEHFPQFIGTGPQARSTAIQRLCKKFWRLAEEFAINGGRLLPGESSFPSSFVLYYSKLLRFFCFSDEDTIGKDEDDEDDNGWERIDVVDDEDDEEMPKNEASPSPRTPGKTSTAAKKKTPSVATLEKDMKTMSVAAGPTSKFVPFNFNHRYILCAAETTYLDDGCRQVYYDYLVNTQVVENFNVTVSEDGLTLKLQGKIPRTFIDLGARSRAEFDVSYANSRVIMSGFRSTVDAIVKTIGPDFDNVWSAGQVDPLPFACRGNPGMQIMWHEGNDALRSKLFHDICIDDDAKHQMMPVLRVTLLSKEVQRKSTVRNEDAVLRRRSSYESGDCTVPPPPSAPYRPRGDHEDFGGGGFLPPGATGGYVYKSNSSSVKAHAAVTQTIKTNNANKNNGSNNNSPRKRKSPKDYFAGQQAGDYDDDGDAKMAENLGINLVEIFLPCLGSSRKGGGTVWMMTACREVDLMA